jgi:folylpolyglutamate synthase
MPWVKSVHPSTLVEIVHALKGNMANVWVANDDEAGGVNQLEKALMWASGQVPKSEPHLIVVAGSLYLVADFYRLSKISV